MSSRIPIISRFFVTIEMLSNKNLDESKREICLMKKLDCLIQAFNKAKDENKPIFVSIGYRSRVHG